MNTHGWRSVSSFPNKAWHMEIMDNPVKPASLPQRCLRATLIIGLILVLIGSAASLPFFFESASMWYKTGSDQALLRTGKVLGVIAACLLLLQLVLSARLRFMDRIFGLNNLILMHRFLGLTILGLVVIHPVLVQLADDMLFIPFQLRYWPEFSGLFLAVLIMGMVLGALWRIPLGIPYHWWRPGHRATAILAFIVLFTHVLNVSETFESGFPRQATFALAGISILFYAWVSARPWRNRGHPYCLTAVDKAGQEAYSLHIKPQGLDPMRKTSRGFQRYFPGQFAFVTVCSDHISKEEHPFTIASSPSRPDKLEFIIRNSGDWTQRIQNLRPGDQVFLDGPYGLFTHLRCPLDQELVMIAGGIGITPMLSILRYMADARDQRRITLVWSNKTREHIIYSEEIEDVQTRLPGLHIFHIFTAPPGGRRLDQDQLAQLLSACSREAAAFICGPPQMLTTMHSALKSIGFSKRRIFMERFSL